MDNENKRYCEAIVEELIAIYDGELTASDDNSYNGLEPGDVVTFYDYFNDVLDIDYIVGSDRETLRGVRLMVTCGGPNVYVNTFNNKIELYWWSEYAEAWLPSEVADAITETFQEYWDC